MCKREVEKTMRKELGRPLGTHGSHRDGPEVAEVPHWNFRPS